MKWSTLPVEQIPDASAIAPHHYIIGGFLALIIVFLVQDNYRHKEPYLVLIGVMGGLFGFLFVWEWYPFTGALLSLLGIIIASVGLFRDLWDQYPKQTQYIAALGLLIMLDDAISHIFGISTPLDALWVNHIIQFVH